MGKLLTDPMVTQALALVLVTVLTGLAAMAGNWLRKRTGNEQAAAVTERALLEVSGAVAEVGQCYVDELRKADADGIITADEAKEARRKAVAIAKANLGPAGVQRLVRALGIDAADVDRWLGTHVEAAVRAEAAPETPAGVLP